MNTTTHQPHIAIIVAASHNNVIGKDNDLPWHLPRDLQYFKKITSGSPIIMGRKTYESIGKALPNRHNIVISRNPEYQLSDASVTHNLNQALVLASAENPDVESIFIIGGATLFQEALSANIATKLYLSRVDANVEGDTFLPIINQDNWRTISSDYHAADDNNEYGVDFQILVRT